MPPIYLLFKILSNAVSNIADTYKYRNAGGSDRKILGKEKNQILAQGEVYTYAIHRKINQNTQSTTNTA